MKECKKSGFNKNRERLKVVKFAIPFFGKMELLPK
jgi:hypothetical protein